MITDKQKFAALLYFHVKDRQEADPKFAPRKAIDHNIFSVVSGRMFPSKKQFDKIVKLWPRLAGTLTFSGLGKTALSAAGAAQFGVLEAAGNAKLRLATGVGKATREAKLSFKPATTAKVQAIRPTVIGKGSSGPMMWAHLGLLAAKSPDAKAWLTVLETAVVQRTPLADLVTTLKTLTQEN